MSDEPNRPAVAAVIPLDIKRGKAKPNGAAVVNGAGFTIADAPADPGAEIARLAALGAIEYDRQREAAAERLGCRVSTLDAAVAAARPKPEGSKGRAATLPAHDPWPDPAPLAATLDALATAVLRHVIVSQAAADAVALWIAHTFVFDRFDHTPRLSVTSPAKRCGKSTLLDVLHATCNRPLRADNISAAGTFRAVEALQPGALLIDEADTFLGENEELRGILNSGFARAGEVIRVVEIDGEHQPVRFRTFAPVALAGIGTLPGTLEDRAVPVVLQRKAAAETVVKLRAPGARAELHDFGRKLARWAADRGVALSSNPEVPDALGDREGDIAVPLLAIADDAGDGWPERAARALLTLFGHRAEDERGAEAGALLLADIRTILADKGATRIPTGELCAPLADMEHRPWPEWRQGEPITGPQLSRVLRPFGVTPIQWRIPGSHQTRGYQCDHFAEVWSRYLGAGTAPFPPDTPLSSRDTRENADLSADVRRDNPAHLSRPESAEIANENSGVPTVPTRDPPLGGEGGWDGLAAGQPAPWETEL